MVGCDLDGLRWRDLVRAGVEQPASGQHTCGISKPHRIPVGFDLARHRPARTRPAVKICEARRIQQQGLHHIRHTNPPLDFLALYTLRSFPLQISILPETVALPRIKLATTLPQSRWPPSRGSEPVPKPKPEPEQQRAQPYRNTLANWPVERSSSS